MSGAIRFDLSASPALAAAILAAHASAGVAAALVLPGVPGLLLGAALLALGMAAAWGRALLRASHSVRAIELTGAEAVFELANGERFAAPIAARRYVSRFMVTLPVGRPLSRTLLVTADMLSRETFRKLRIWALWGRLPGVAAKQLPA